MEEVALFERRETFVQVRHFDAQAGIAADQADQPVHYLVGVKQRCGRHDCAAKAQGRIDRMRIVMSRAPCQPEPPRR